MDQEIQDLKQNTSSRQNKPSKRVAYSSLPDRKRIEKQKRKKFIRDQEKSNIEIQKYMFDEDNDFDQIR